MEIMDKVVERHGAELLSYMVDGNTVMFNEKLRDISSNSKILQSLFTWTSNIDDDKHKQKNTLLMNAIELNNQKIFDILMKNEVCNICCIVFLCGYALTIMT